MWVVQINGVIQSEAHTTLKAVCKAFNVPHRSAVRANEYLKGLF